MGYKKLDSLDIKHYIFFDKEASTERYVEILGNELVKWAKSDKNAYMLSQFFALYELDRRDFYVYRKKYDSLKRKHNIAMDILAARREVGALKRKLDSNIVRASMPIYSKEWRDLREWEMKIRENSNNKNNDVKVVLLKDFPKKK